MADIAFVRWIFFVVTTTIGSDQGILVRLPQWTDVQQPTRKNKHNILLIHVNKSDQLLVNEVETEIEDLKIAAIDFLDNNRLGECDYCAGNRNNDLSDHPLKAIISLHSDRATSYNININVYNELRAAYNELRNMASIEKFELPFIQLIQSERDVIKKMYPMKLSEAEPNEN